MGEPDRVQVRSLERRALTSGRSISPGSLPCFTGIVGVTADTDPVMSDRSYSRTRGAGARAMSVRWNAHSFVEMAGSGGA